MGIKIFLNKVFDKVKNNSSDIKMGVGTAGVIGGTIVLCREAIRANEIVKGYRTDKQTLIDNGAEKKDIRKLKGKAAGKVALTVLPGVLLEGAGLGSMWSGYSNTKAALVGVGAAYSGLQEFIDKYRAGVREKYGEEEDERLAYNFRTEEVVTVNADGEEKTETIRIFPRDQRKMPSPYARYFCYGEAEGAEKSFTYNGSFLECQQSLANGRFRAHKKYMLNDLYDQLGIKRSVAGNHVGWIYDPEAPEGDNRIDFRIQVVYREVLDENGNYVGWERIHMIDPNVDGMVEEKMVRLGLMDE